MAKKEPKKIRGVFERPRDSGIWWVRYADELGRIHRERVGFRQTAIQIYQQRKTEVRQGKFRLEDVKRKNKSMAEVIRDRLEQARSLKSYAGQVTFLSFWLKEFGDKPVRSVLPGDIEARRRQLESIGLKPASVNRYLAALKSTFSLAIKNGKAEKNPVQQVKYSKENNNRVRWLTDEEETRLFTILPQKYHPLVTVALHTGLRKSEQFKLEWRDIDFKEGFITVRESKPGESRIIPMNETVEGTLRRLPRVINNPHVFVGKEPGTRRTDLPKFWEKYLVETGIENFHWHDLRHTFASRLVMAGVDLYKVKKLLGHHDLKMTERYAHLAPGYLKEAVGLLSRKSNQLAPELAPTNYRIS